MISHAVIIVGAGPTGLMLAGELRGRIGSSWPTPDMTARGRFRRWARSPLPPLW